MTTDTRDYIVSRLAPIYGRGEALAMAQWIAEEPDDSYCLDEVLERLLRSEPLQYIFGHTDWRGIRLSLSPHTLIPRPETSELVDEVLRIYRTETLSGPVLDIGTGTGCIPIALALSYKKMPLYACEISVGALQTAIRNANATNVFIHFFQQDILAPDAAAAIQRQTKCQQFSIIVSNPPYICEQEKQTMDPNVLLYEPAQALFVPDTDPLLFYRAIARLHLAPILCFEINQRYGPLTAAMLHQEGYTDTQIIKDICGNERILIARK